jgi:hypothetical protein
MENKLRGGVKIRVKNKKIFGIGVNDADYNVQNMSVVNGKVVRITTCPYYERWYDMFRRVYGRSLNRKFNTYSDLEVCKEWQIFSNFKTWMESQEWEGKFLDKYVLSALTGFKSYGPECCAFVSMELNGFFVLRGNDRGLYPVGVSKKGDKYSARLNKGDNRVWLGVYNTPEQAHKAWQLAKYNYGVELLKKQTDTRVISAMHVILHNLGEDYAAGRITNKLV